MNLTRTSTTRCIAAGLSAAVLIAACGGSDDDGEAAVPEPVECAAGQTDGDLALYNWSEYIDDEQLAEFQSEFGVGLTQDTFDSNEAMQAVVSQGNSGYDVIMPSDYMVGIMASAGNLQPLNAAAIPNLSNLDPEFADRPFDPGNVFSAPYQVGTTGIAVDTDVVGTDFPRSWGLIFDPAISDQYSGKITLLNDPREVLGAALKYLGHSVNTTDQGQLDEAKDLVAAAKSNLAAFDTDSADELLVSGETAIAHGYSGDMFGQIIETDDPDRYEYFVPQEGGVRWIDNMAITFDAPHPCTAHTFINWLLDGEQGAALTNFNYYDTPNAAAVAGLDEDLLAFTESPDTVTGGVDSLELIEDTGDFEINFSDAFFEAKG